ncbi:MAG: tetratricopeptide repeat protein [Candidatus Dadabacteria bacterium]|nr:tetratricopeptide repeat protein [Candidatus Dadabacteria bacterium]
MGFPDRRKNLTLLCIISLVLTVMNPLTAIPQNYETSQQSKPQIEQNNLNLLKLLTLSNKVMDLIKEGKYKVANAIAEIAYNFAIKNFGDKSFEVASSLYVMALSSYELGDLIESQKYYHMAIEVYESINLDNETKKVAYIASLIGLSTIYLEQKNNIESEKLILKIIELYEDNPSLDRSILAKNYDLLANIKLSQYHFSEYRDICLKSIKIKENLYGFDSPELIHPLMMLSEAYFHLGEYSYSIEILDRVLKIAEKNLETENLLFARILSDQSVSYQYLSYFKKSKELAIKALEIKKKLLGKDDPSIAITLNALGIISEFGEKNYIEALSYYQEALAIEKKAYGTNRIAAALYLENIGGVYKRLGNYNEAESHIQDALRIYENDSSEATNHSSYLMALTSLADIKFFQNKQNEAKEIYEKALKLARENKLNTNYYLILILNSLGAFYLDELDEPEKGLNYIDESLKLLNLNGELTYNIFDYTIDSVTMSAFINRASALTYLYMHDNTVIKDLSETIKTALKFMELYRRSINDKDVRFNQWEKLSVFFELTLAIHELEKFKHGKPPNDTFNFFESSISRNLTEELSKRYIQTSKEIPAKVLDKENSFFQTRVILQTKIIKGDSDEDRNKFKDEYVQNEKQLGLFIDSLHKRFPSYAQLNYPRPVSLTTVQNELLSGDNIALAYYLGSSNSFLMVVTKNDIDLFRLKLNRDEIFKKIEQLRNTTLWYENKEEICEISVKPFKKIKKERKLVEEISNELYGILIEPASQYLKDKKEIVIIPHSHLWLLPFEVLGNKDGKL